MYLDNILKYLGTCKFLLTQSESSVNEQSPGTLKCNLKNVCSVFLHFVFLTCRVDSLEEELSVTKEEKEGQLKLKMEQCSQSLQHQHDIQEAKVN